ncbi:MAG: FliG C-terminal domain-containing protein [Planctomycetaceae bacterium]|nr:hypothetical protein [Planctomycetaceae bacterium]
MKVFHKLWLRLKAQASVTGRIWQGAAAALAVLAVAGGIWLMASDAAPQRKAVFAQPLPAEHVKNAAGMLAGGGIECQIVGGRLLVHPDSLAAARKILIDASLTPQDLAAQAATAQEDIWLSESQRAQRAAAAKADRLARLIGQFPDVEFAEVLFEPAQPGKIGQPSVSATAAVNLRMRAQSRMTAQLVNAIADLLSGSIAGLDRAAVRIIDQRGRSYAAGDETLMQEDRLANRARVSDYWQQRIAGALTYVPGLTVTVQVAPEGESCTAASLLAPRSYFETIARTRNLDLQQVTRDELARIAAAAARIIGADARAVMVDSYTDALSDEALAAAFVGHSQPRRGAWAIAASAALVLAGAGCAVAVLRRRRRRPKAASASEQPPSPAEHGSADDGAIRRLERLADDDLLWVLASEQTQTIAIVLSRMSPRRAAAVLAALDGPVARQVVMHLARPPAVDERTVQDVLATLTDRLNALHTPQGQGQAVIREILTHADGASGGAVMQLVASSQPQLARNIRRDLLAFEDLGLVGDDELRDALATLDPQVLAVALRTAGQVVRSKIFHCLGSRATRDLRRQMDTLPPVRLSEVEAAQDHVARAVRRCGTTTDEAQEAAAT